jgi:hypothetical protein
MSANSPPLSPSHSIVEPPQTIVERQLPSKNPVCSRGEDSRCVRESDLRTNTLLSILSRFFATRRPGVFAPGGLSKCPNGCPDWGGLSANGVVVRGRRRVVILRGGRRRGRGRAVNDRV